MHQHRYRFPDPKRLALNIRPSPKNSTAQHGVRADNSQKTTAQQLLANSYADSKRGRMQHQGPEPLQEWFCGYRRGRTRGGKAFAGLLASRQSVGADISRICDRTLLLEYPNLFYANIKHAGEPLHKSKPVIASAAKQSIFVCQSSTYGSPRRCAPRDDGLMQTFLSEVAICRV